VAGIYIETFGCQMNEADSQYIADRADAAGYTLVSEPRAASVIVLNTCTVRDNAERRAYGRMQHMRALKVADPAVKLVVCGCLAEQDRDRMQTIAPHVDAVFGTSELVRFGDTLERWRAEFDEAVPSDERMLVEEMGGHADCIPDAFSHLRAFVTVQRGCSYYCTFCIVPHVRGRFDHRPAAEILAEVRTALDRGAREITLVGQTVNAYADPADGSDFSQLLERVAALDDLERLTFVTSHPKDFNERLVATLAALPNVNPRLHLPVQSGSDPILRRMNRKYTVAQYLDKIDGFRAACNDWALTTDLIVGFPGESDADFEQTLELCARVGFAQAFMFVYSPRRGTPAALWEQVSAETGAERLRRLNDAVGADVCAYHARKTASVVRALVVGRSRKDPTRIAAKTPDNVTIIAPLDGRPVATFAERPWIDVAVESSHVWGCAGRLVGAARRYAEPAQALPEPALDLVSLL
jgi:tRNA-2-methylthio-N6-dimethylallyladenosine synthase